MTEVSKGFLRPTTTPTPDEIFDQWLPRLSGAELKVLLYIVRRTFGFKKEADSISLTQICSGITKRDGEVLDRGTGIARNTASKAVKQLEKLGLIAVERTQDDLGEHATNIYRLRFRGYDSSPEGGDDDSPNPDGDEVDSAGNQGGDESVPPPVNSSHHPGEQRQPPVGQKSNPQQTDPQETALQQTGEQETESQQPAPPPAEGICESAAPARETPSQAGGAGDTDPEAIPDRPPVQLTLVHPPPTTHATQQPVSPERQQSVDILVAFGVWRVKAEQLVERLGLDTETVERACAALNDELKRRTSIANPGAVLVSRLESGWEPPPAPPNPYAEWDRADDEPVPTALPVDSRPPLPPVETAHGTEHNAYGWFAALKGDLQPQLPRETYDTWLRSAELADHVPASEDAPATFTVQLHSVYAKAWVEQRLNKVIRLSWIHRSSLPACRPNG